MSKSKHRKKLTSSTGPHRAEPKKGRIGRWVKAVTDHPLVSLGGLAATVIALWGFVVPEFYGPTVAVSEGGALLPFAAPISVTNNSSWFELQNVTIRCGVKEIKFIDGGGIEGITFRFGGPETIAPKGTGNFQCKIVNAPNQYVTTADLMVTADYAMFGYWHRQSPATEIAWFRGANPPRWIKGQFPNQVQ